MFVKCDLFLSRLCRTISTLCRGLVEKEINSTEELLKLLISTKDGDTKSNDNSSCSHTIFTIKVKVGVKEGDKTVRHVGKLHMVDLAGSENANTSTVSDQL